MVNIFEIESRIHLESEYVRIKEYIKFDSFKHINSSYEDKFFNVVDRYFHSWKYRRTALDTRQYLDILLSSGNYEQKDIILIELQLIYNLCYFLIKEEYVIGNQSSPYMTLIENIQRVLEGINMSPEIKNDDQIIFVKRDPDVDSVLQYIANEENTKIAILEYNDFLIREDIDRKREILRNIYAYIENNKQKYKNHNNTIFSDIGFLVNSFSIRHNDLKQKAIHNKNELLDIYDLTFKMMLHLIRGFEINNEFKVIKTKYQTE